MVVCIAIGKIKETKGGIVMDIIAIVFLIAGKVANVKGLMTTAIVISAVCIVLNLSVFAATKDKNTAGRATVGMVIDAILLTISIIFRVGM